MFMEFLTHLLALDVEWLATLLLVNLHWLFFFVALIYMFCGGKNILKGVFVVTMLSWLYIDFGNLMGISILVGGYLIMTYLGKLAVLAWAENSPGLQNKLIPISEIQGISVLVLFLVLVSWGLM